MTSDPKINSLLEQANKLFLDKKFKEAISFYDQILQSHPSNISALNNKGYASSKLGDYLGAISCYDAALKIDSNDTSVIINKISSLRKLEKFDDALHYCNDLLGKSHANNNNNDNVVLYHKERLLFSLGDFSGSLDCCNKILCDYPSNGDILFDKSCCLAKLDRPIESLIALEQSITISKKFQAKAKTNNSFESLCNNDKFVRLVNNDS